jgi:hypothetical protein
MWRRTIAEVQHHLVDLAPTPAFWRIVALDDRMASGVVMLGRMAVGRVVAAADVAAGATEAQVYPSRADLEAVLAAKRAWGHVANGIGMRAFLCHYNLCWL